MRDIEQAICDLLLERPFSLVEKQEHVWVFQFSEAVTLTAECPWRILTSGIAFSDSDDGQQFGLSSPLNVENALNLLLCGKTVTHVSTRESTADLSIAFSEHGTLELLNLSGGYEAWQLQTESLLVVAQGGGKLVSILRPKF